MRRTVLFIAALCICFTSTWAISHRVAGDNKLTEPIVPRRASLPVMDGRSGTLRLIATGGGDNEISLVPTNVTAAEELESPVLASVLIPKDSNRTHLFLALGAEREWMQVPSTSAYRFGGHYRLIFTSSVLPSPGQMRIRLPFDSQTEFQPSAVQIQRFSDPLGSFGLDAKLMTGLVRGNFPSLTEEQAQSLTNSLLQSEMKVEMAVVVRIRSVESFDIGSAYLQAWGD